MSYQTIYRAQFVNQETTRPANENIQQIITIDISDTESPDESGDQTIHELELTDTPLKISIIDNSEDKFKVIRAKQAAIQIYSSNIISIDTFAQGGGTRWFVEIYSQLEMLFVGWLSTSDLRSQFMPDPNVIDLVATDGLGFLNDEPLVNLDGENPQNEWRIIDYLTWALTRTGLSLDIYAVMNIREKTAKSLNADNVLTFSSIANYSTPSGRNKIRVVGPNTFFSIGMSFTITGDNGGNNGPFTVEEIQSVGSDIDIYVQQTVLVYGGVTVSNFITGTPTTGHFFIHEYLDAKTFEEEIGTSEDCYSVIEKILGKECTLLQHNGVWWIIRIDEIQYLDSYYVSKFSEGEWIQNFVIELKKYVGVNLPLSWMNDDAEVSLENAIKKLILTFNYQNPQELLCNVDLSRGDGAGPTGAASETIDYTPECWQYLREDVAPEDWDQPPFSGAVGVLRKLYEYNYEKDRYLFTQVAGGFIHYFKSEPVNVAAGSKINISVQYKYNSDVGAATVNVAHVRLLGYDGSIYDWRLSVAIGYSQWILKDATDNLFADVIQEDVPSSIDLTDWHAFSFTSAPVPVAGVINVRLLNNLASPPQRFFTGINFQYTPLVNGSYAKYEGHTHTIDQDEKTKIFLKDVVYIGDAPDRNMKGCILKKIGSTFGLTDGFYNAAVLPNGYTNIDQVHPYGELQAFDVWNQYNRTMRKFEGTIDGLQSDNAMPDIIHKFFLTDLNQSTNSKVFMLLHYDMDMHLCEWEAFLHEVHDNTINKQYLNHVFKYITGNE